MSEATIKLPRELFALAESSRFQGTFDLPTLSSGPDDYAFAQPVQWEVEVTNTGAAFLVSGHARASATVACSRCLEEVAYDLNGTIEGYFVVEGANAEAPDGAPDGPDGEFDVLPADHVIDLAPLICAALLMDAPGMPLCRDDCAGLCASCGANLNDGKCGCGGDADLEAFERQASPFAALADLEFEE